MRLTQEQTHVLYLVTRCNSYCTWAEGKVELAASKTNLRAAQTALQPYRSTIVLLLLLLLLLLEQVMKAQRGCTGSSYSFFNLGTRWGRWSKPRPCRFTSGKEILFPLYRRLREPQGRYGRVQTIWLHRDYCYYYYYYYYYVNNGFQILYTFNVIEDKQSFASSCCNSSFTGTAPGFLANLCPLAQLGQ